MKRLIFLVGLILVCRNLFAGEIEVKSKISEVIVYPDYASVVRKASLELNPAEYKIIFPDIIPEIDENFLKVSAKGQAEVKLFGASLKREYLEEIPSERIKQLKERIQQIEDQIKILENTKKLLLEEKDFLDSIRLFSKEQIPQDLVTKMPTPKDLEEILKFLDTKLRENYSQVMDCEFKMRDLANKVETLKRELSEISGPQKKLKRSIIVELKVLKEGSFDLNVSYLVKGASWQPIYDARANFVESLVELVCWGIVKQTTGEDWQDVEISLSTAKPAIGGRMPYVAPWFLRPYQPPRVMKEKELRVFQFEAIAPLEVEPEIEYAKVEEKGIAVVYKLPHKVTIKSDGSEHKLPIFSQVLQAKFEYSTFPKASTFAYLRSRVTNAKELQLLSARVNIFLEGDFVGTSSINNIAPGEEFDLYLGVDENVKVKREQIEKKIDDVLFTNIPAPNRRITFKYKITIENYKNKKIKVNLFEAMPVSEDKRIKVRIFDLSLEPKEKDWEDKKGVFRWELELEPRQKQEIFYKFSIEHPRDMVIECL